MLKQPRFNLLLMQLIIMKDYSSSLISKEDTSIVVFRALQEKNMKSWFSIWSKDCWEQIICLSIVSFDVVSVQLLIVIYSLKRGSFSTKLNSRWEPRVLPMLPPPARTPPPEGRLAPWPPPPCPAASGRWHHDPRRWPAAHAQFWGHPGLPHTPAWHGR